MSSNKKYESIKKSVEAVQPGDKIAVLLNNDANRQYVQGEYVAMGEEFLLMVSHRMSLNGGNNQMVISIPFSAIRYIEFPNIKVEANG